MVKMKTEGGSGGNDGKHKSQKNEYIILTSHLGDIPLES
jgi:hypothetical protein